jgi:hypothetical protein
MRTANVQKEAKELESKLGATKKKLFELARDKPESFSSLAQIVGAYGLAKRDADAASKFAMEGEPKEAVERLLRGEFRPRTFRS